jgi:CheY-like chemotaxis protein
MAKRVVKKKGTKKGNLSRNAKKAVKKKIRKRSKQLSATPKRYQPTVLIADDDKMFRHVLAELFKNEGFRVTCTAGVDDSIDSVCKRRFDVIILDMHMPEEPGHPEIKPDAGLIVTRLLRRYADMDKSVIVVVFTGYPSVQDCFATVDSGAYYLPKYTLDMDEHMTEMGYELAKECKRLHNLKDKEAASRLWLVDNYVELTEKFPGQTIAVLDEAAQTGDLKTTNIAGSKVVSAPTAEKLHKRILRNPLLRNAEPIILEIWKEED